MLSDCTENEMFMYTFVFWRFDITSQREIFVVSRRRNRDKNIKTKFVF